jgi:hypothetical protein
MKSMAVLFATIFIASANLFAEQATQKETQVNVSDVYIQRSRGVVEAQELLLTGLFPNGCYKWVRADVKHETDYIHEVRAIGKVTQGMCIMVMVPFTKEVDLGVLKEGTHTVRVMNADGTSIEKQFEL